MIARKCPESPSTLRAVRLLSMEAAAIAADVNERTIRRWLSAGKLTRYERRIRVLADTAELRALVRQKPQRPATKR